MARLEIFSVANGKEVLDPFDANQMAQQGSVAVRQAACAVGWTKPRVATELSKYRLCLHEASHAALANLAFGRPIVRVTINPDDKGNIGHTWSYHNGKANRDDLVIVAAGRIAEEELLGDVFEIGCTGDDEALRSLALKLAHGDANTLLRETEASHVHSSNSTPRPFGALHCGWRLSASSFSMKQKRQSDKRTRK